MKQDFLVWLTLFIVISGSLAVYYLQSPRVLEPVVETTYTETTPDTVYSTPLLGDTMYSITTQPCCSTSILAPTLNTSPSTPGNHSTTCTLIYTTTPLTTTREVSNMLFMNCSMQGVLVEFKAHIKIIRDNELLEKIRDAVEKHVKSTMEKGFEVPDETLKLLELLQEPGDRIALLEIVLEIKNKGNGAIQVYGGPPGCGFILDYIVKNIMGGGEPLGVKFTNLIITPVKGSASAGEGLFCIAVVYSRILQPGESIQNTYYYIIKKPDINENFEATVEASIIGFNECKLVFKVVY